MIFFRFINARRRIVQPLIDQSNRTGAPPSFQILQIAREFLWPQGADFMFPIGAYPTSPSGYPSGDPTGMGYMMDAHPAAAAAMIQGRPDAAFEYPHAAYAGYYGHM